MAASVGGMNLIVTGAASGIGRATALRALDDGAAVALWDLDLEAIESIARQARTAGGRVIAIRVDVSSAQSVADGFQQTVAQLGGFDGAFNNAGIGAPMTLIEEISEAAFDRVLGVNLRGVWLCMREQIKHLKANGGGVIVNNASIAGLVALQMQAAYGAAKHGVIGLTKVAAVECAPQGVRVNAICPGAVQTPILAHLEQAGIDQAALAAMSPQNRIADPREIAETVIWLLSSASSFMTGAAVPVDGGWTAQ